MSTAQGPYKAESLPDWAEGAVDLCELTGRIYDDLRHHGKHFQKQYKAARDMAEASMADALNAAYAEGQRSKQAELDKAVELLRAFANADEWVEGISMVFMPQSEWDKMNAAMLAAQAYLADQPSPAAK